MKKKGFTLIELLAVIVILAIIALVAVPIILNVIEKSKQSSAESSAYGYLDAVEKYAALNQVDNVTYPYNIKNGTYNVVEEVDNVPGVNTFISLKGEKPDSGELLIDKKGKVVHAELVISGYIVVCENNICRVTGTAAVTSRYGLFNENGELLASWDKLVNTYHLDIEKDYSSTTSADNYYKKEGSGSMYDVLTNNSELSNAKKLVIPDTITKIGAYAFYQCSNLTSVIIPNSVTSIGTYSLASTGLTSAIIPDSVTSLGARAFYSSKELTIVTLSDSIKNIEKSTFEGCIKLENITIPSSVKNIYDSAFKKTNIESLDIPDSVKYIDDNVFLECKNLKTVTIGSGVTFIGRNVFNLCEKLESITVNTNNTVFDSHDNSNAIIKISDHKLVAGSVNTIIPNDIITIGSRAFYGVKIKNVTIPLSVTAIDEEAFGFNSLETVTFEDPNNWRKCSKGSSYNVCDSYAPNLTNPSNNPSLLNAANIFLTKS